MIKVTYTERFQKSYKSLSVNDKKQFKKKILLLSENPLHPSLRTKRIQGTEALFEFSVNMDIRVIWFYSGEDIVALVDIGHHDILKKY